METPGKVLVVGSGPITIAEAAEFDYSGSQALKALREEGVEAVLVNSNVATIQTSHGMASRVYLGPVTSWFVEKVIEEERPDGIMLGFGGQTALSIGVDLWDREVLQKYGVKVLGTPVEGIRKALSRSLFRAAMTRAGIPMPPSRPAGSPGEALEAAEEIGYPVIVRVSFNLGGGGSFIAWSRGELERWIERAFAQAGVSEVLVEKYLHHWKEVEFEVVRDYKGNAAAIACMENVDPMGVHTGDSIVVAPCQTMDNREWYDTRWTSLRVAEEIQLVGEANVQLALDPKGSATHYVIETNPRMSRSSALASKATGYPLAYIAAKLALGYTLCELVNTVTGKTTACFEPSLDYVVVKVPRWDLEKFDGAIDRLDSEMKSVGEVMAIGRSFIEALLKATRMVGVDKVGVFGEYYIGEESLENVMKRLGERKPYWPLHAAKALKLGASVDKIHEATGIDKFFLMQLEDAVRLAEELRREGLSPERLAEAKLVGLSDEEIAFLTGGDWKEVMREREEHGLRPHTRRIDTVAGEVDAESNYLYLTYNAWEDEFHGGPARRILILGAGGFRIGVSVEFDWSVVEYLREARRLGYDPVILNFNPETVSTDWDVAGNLYFDEVRPETVKEVASITGAEGVAAFMAGQLGNTVAKRLEEAGLRLIGGRGDSIDLAERKSGLNRLLERAGVELPPWTVARSHGEAERILREVGLPAIVRPAYIIGGSRVRIAWSLEELVEAVREAVSASLTGEAIVAKYIEGVEVDVDAVTDGRGLAMAILEHVEEAGVHSGDSTMILPPRLPGWATKRLEDLAWAVVEETGYKGPFNFQAIIAGGRVYLVEVNLRASRSMPFTSKATRFNLAAAAAHATLKGSLGIQGTLLLNPPEGVYAVKSPQFSWQRLKGAYPGLGPEMRSTGESAYIGRSLHEALLMSWLGAKGNRLPRPGEKVLVYTPTGRGADLLGEAAKLLERAGYEAVTLKGQPDELGWLPSLGYEEAVNEVKERRVGLLVTTGYAPEKDYSLRRAAADMNVPLVLNHRLARILAEAITRVDPASVKPEPLKPYTTPTALEALKEKA